MDPYQTPGPAYFVSGGSQTVDEKCLRALQRTKPWVTFFAVILFLFAGLMVLGGLGFFAFSLIKQEMFMAGVGLFYALFGGFYIFLGQKMWAVSASIGRLLNHPHQDGLFQVLDRNRSLWKTFGISTIVFLAIYLVAIVAAIALPLLGAH